MDSTQRYDIYAFIHKGLRKAMSEALVALGNVDAVDDDEFDRTVEQVKALLHICQRHVEHENDFVHPAMEARRPGSSRNIANQHIDHEAHIQHLHDELIRIQRLPGLRRALQLHAYYREFALWMADNFVHMEQEERDHNAVLWAAYTDEEIRTIEQDLVAHVEPADATVVQRYMLPAMTPAERAWTLRAARSQMPEAVFNDVLAMLQRELGKDHYRKLVSALATDDLTMAHAI